MLSAFVNAFKTPDLRRKLLFVLGVIVLFRLGSTLPAPGINVSNVQRCVDLASQGENSSLFALINVFSGGALLQLTVFALGIMPYITASIILQLLVVVIPRLEALKKEGQSGQAKITQYTRYLTLGLAVLQATGIVALARSGQLFGGVDCGDLLYRQDSILAFLLIVLVMVSGTAVIMWLGELITDRGVGNGMSILIFTQVVAPLKVNQAGIIPVIFASSLLYLPALYAQFRPDGVGAVWINDHFVRGDHPYYMITYFALIVFFAYFYVAITFNPEEVADNMKKYGGFIPGIRAGRPTQDYLAYVLSRITAPGAVYLGMVALIPMIAVALLGASQNFPFGGTSILIIVGVGLDTVKQIESQLQQRNYEGFLR
ncbi:MAG: preprotein translocase subunit SecY [Actinomycetales bacterium]|nr:MAG: preprotein translocase subunit SecY [Actinomycetales bacterium]